MIAFDQDLDAIDKVSKDLSHELTSGNLEIIHTNFANLQGSLIHCFALDIYAAAFVLIIYDMFCSIYLMLFHIE